MTVDNVDGIKEVSEEEDAEAPAEEEEAPAARLSM